MSENFPAILTFYTHNSALSGVSWNFQQVFWYMQAVTFRFGLKLRILSIDRVVNTFLLLNFVMIFYQGNHFTKSTFYGPPVYNIDQKVVNLHNNSFSSKHISLIKEERASWVKGGEIIRINSAFENDSSD
jgi:hypothetical protein